MDNSTDDLEKDLDAMISEIEKEITVSETKEVTVKEDVASFDSLIKKALDNINTIDKTADNIHELFYHDLALKIGRAHV